MSPDEDEDSGADSLNEQISKTFFKLKSANIDFNIHLIQCYILANLKRNLYRGDFQKKQAVYFLIFLLFSMYLLDGNVMKVSKFSRTAFFYFGNLLKRQFLGKQILWTCFPVFHSFLRFLLNLSLIEISNRKHTKHKSW